MTGSAFTLNFAAALPELRGRPRPSTRSSTTSSPPRRGRRGRGKPGSWSTSTGRCRGSCATFSRSTGRGSRQFEDVRGARPRGATYLDLDGEPAARRSSQSSTSSAAHDRTPSSGSSTASSASTPCRASSAIRPTAATATSWAGSSSASPARSGATSPEQMRPGVDASSIPILTVNDLYAARSGSTE